MKTPKVSKRAKASNALKRVKHLFKRSTDIATGCVILVPSLLLAILVNLYNTMEFVLENGLGESYWQCLYHIWALLATAP